MSGIRLYHTGYRVIREPDLTRGRKNADFGQGFYLTADRAFAERWAREKPGETVYVNVYSFDPEGLKTRTFSRDGEWAEYVFANRSGLPDRLAEYDVITGPIANDTLFNVLGLTSSNLLNRDALLSVLQTGPLYTQTVIKTPSARAGLQWLSAEPLALPRLEALRASFEEEEKNYLTVFSKKLEQVLGFSDSGTE